jgi:hypothetical protein
MTEATSSLTRAGGTYVISYSLYGSGAKYMIGALENLSIAKEIYVGWEVVFYLGRSVPTEVKLKLLLAGAKVIEIDAPENSSAMLWRWLPFLEEKNEVVVVRDCDSRLSIREYHAVEEWLASGYSLHIMRDHPLHTAFIMGGMWGGRVRRIAPLLSFLKNPDVFNDARAYGDDQILLERLLYKPLYKDAFCHDEYTLLSKKRQSFAPNTKGSTFVGQVIEHDGRPNREHTEKLLEYRRSRLKRFVTKSKTLIKRIIRYGS